MLSKIGKESLLLSLWGLWKFLLAVLLCYNIMLVSIFFGYSWIGFTLQILEQLPMLENFFNRFVGEYDNEGWYTSNWLHALYKGLMRCLFCWHNLGIKVHAGFSFALLTINYGGFVARYLDSCKRHGIGPNAAVLSWFNKVITKYLF